MMLTRRDCLRIGVAASGALLIGWPARSGQAQASGATELALWVLIDPQNNITLRSNASEMGQGASSALVQILSEELELAWGDARLVMASIEPQFFGLWTDYVTGGSATVRGMFEKLRMAGATARELLLREAARRWNIETKRCVLRAKKVIDSETDRQFTFGELAAEAARLKLDAPVAPKARAHWKVIGREVERLDLRDKITGRTVFGIDAGPRDALYAAIVHAPRFGAKLKNVKHPNGSARFVVLPDAFAAVAGDYWSAHRALQACNVEWTEPEELVSEADYRKHLQAGLAQDGEIRFAEATRHAQMRDSNDQAFSRAARVFEKTYETPLLAHTCMEPMNATASVGEASAEIWAPTQAQASTRRDVARVLNLPENQVTVHTSFMGGGFGRRLQTDYAVQAALIAREIGRPVKLIWSRGQDLQHDFYRQAAMARIRCAVQEDGEILGTRVQLAALGDCSPGGMPPYALGNLLVTNVKVPSAIPLGSWRSIEANHNTFFMESFVDELAMALGQTPLELRRRLLASQPRALKTFEAAVAASGWERAPTRGHHFGVSLCDVFGSVCAQVIEVSVTEPHAIRIHKVTSALDCGTAVNPDSVRAQMEGGIVMGLSAACLERVVIENGRVAQSNFHDYPILRLAQVPTIECLVLSSPDAAIGGCGEPPVPPVAPALANALFAATGTRIRTLPLAVAGWRLV